MGRKLPKFVWAGMLWASHDKLIEFAHADVPTDWEKWSINDRHRWWKDAEYREKAIKMGRTRKRDRLAAVEVWCEFFGYQREDFTQMYSRQVNWELEHIPGLSRAKTCLRCGPYGIQRGFRVE